MVSLRDVSKKQSVSAVEFDIMQLTENSHYYFKYRAAMRHTDNSEFKCVPHLNRNFLSIKRRYFL